MTPRLRSTESIETSRHPGILAGMFAVRGRYALDSFMAALAVRTSADRERRQP